MDKLIFVSLTSFSLIKQKTSFTTSVPITLMSQLSATSIGVGSEDRITAITIPRKATNRMWSVKMRGSMWMFVGVICLQNHDQSGINFLALKGRSKSGFQLKLKAWECLISNSNPLFEVENLLFKMFTYRGLLSRIKIANQLGKRICCFSFYSAPCT